MGVEVCLKLEGLDPISMMAGSSRLVLDLHQFRETGHLDVDITAARMIDGKKGNHA